MEDIIIRKHEDGGLEVFQGDRRSGELTYEEAVGLIAALVMPENRRCLDWMKTDAQHDVRKRIISPPSTSVSLRELAENHLRARVPGWPEE